MDRPILFSGQMVRALLDGRKTVTRRAVKPQPPYDAPLGHDDAWFPPGDDDEDVPPGHWSLWHGMNAGEYGSPPWEGDFVYATRCPCGQPGDRLWVREAWRTAAMFDGQSPREIAEACIAAEYPKPWAPVRYEADGARDNWCASTFGRDAGKLRPSIHMPRWASRITLEVTDVRVERLRDIDHTDALREGVEPDEPGSSAVPPFARLWNGINAKRGYSWEDNPWVWRVAFEVSNG